MTALQPAPHAYQLQGIDFLAERARALLGDDAGLGKSLQMIRAANKADYARVLVVCPAIGRVSWALQFQTWDETRRPVTADPHAIPPTGPVAAIVTMDWLSRGDNAERFIKARHRFDAVFVDEAHYLKTPSARRTKAVYGARLNLVNSVSQGAKAVWVATATFAPNNAGELYTHLKALLPDELADLFGGRLPTKHQFEETFCNLDYSRFGVRVTGNNPRTIPHLRRMLGQHLLSRRKADVLKDLPPISCVPLPFELAPADLKEAAIDAFFEGLPPDRVEADGDLLSVLGAALADPAIAARRRALGLAKGRVAATWVREFLEGSDPGTKLVVFAHHRDVIEALRLDLLDYDPLVLHGATRPSDKAAHVARFQTDKAKRLFIGQTHAAGTSITLTAASDVLLLEPDWSPANNYQAISRCHRIGQTGGVVARFAYAAGTIDQRIASLLRRRAADALDLFGTAPAGFTDKNQ